MARRAESGRSEGKDLRYLRKSGDSSLHELACHRDLLHQHGDLLGDRRDGFAGDGAVGRPDQVDLQRGVELRVVAAVVAATRLAALQRRLEGGPGGERRRPEVEGVGEI